jgi:hypothetical protein
MDDQHTLIRDGSAASMAQQVCKEPRSRHLKAMPVECYQGGVGFFGPGGSKQSSKTCNHNSESHMLPHTNHRRALNLLAKLSIGPILLILVAAVSIRPAVADSDILYAGDIASNTVRRFNAETGSPISGGSSSGVFVQSGSGGLVGPMGLLPKSGKLVVVNQNVNLPKPGEILRYKLNDGAVDGALVPFSDDHAPFAPRGIVIW